MALERWNVLWRWIPTGEAKRDLDALAWFKGNLIEIPTTGTKDTQVKVAHGLNRTPQGMRIVNLEVPNPIDGEPAWYRQAPDDTWDSREIRFRFRASNARLLVEVF